MLFKSLQCNLPKRLRLSWMQMSGSWMQRQEIMGIKMETIGEGEGAGKVEGIATTTLAATCLVEVVVVAAVLVAAEEVAAEEGAVVAEAMTGMAIGEVIVVGTGLLQVIATGVMVGVVATRAIDGNLVRRHSTQW